MGAVTPNHLLLGGDNPALPVSPPESNLRYCQSRWKYVQHLVDVFWSRWRKEYLPYLRIRPKWTTEHRRNLKINDLVLVVDGDVPIGNWPSAVVQKFSLVLTVLRRVKLRLVKSGSIQGRHSCDTTILERPVRKIVLVLPWDQVPESVQAVV